MRLAALALLTLSAALAEPPAFDVASIRTLKARGPGRPDNIQTAPGTLTMRNIRLRACIRWAYGVDEVLIKGPDSLTAGWYDIIAKAEGPPSDEQMKIMLQTLLADRFQLLLHRETKTMAVYTLEVAKGGPKFHASESEGESDMQPLKSGAGMGVTGHRIPISQVAELLSRILQAPVIDQTGLTGRYDMNVDASAYLSGDNSSGGMPAIVSSILTGLQEQLGLKLESKKLPMDLLVIDRLERIPTEN